MIVFLNGEFVGENEALVSVFDRSFQYGDGLFESIRISNGKPFRWDQHLDRLTQGASFLQITLPFSNVELRVALEQLLETNQMREAVLRITLSRGVGHRGYSPRGVSQPTMVMSLHALAQKDPDRLANWTLATSRFRVPSRDPLLVWKTANKLRSVLARAEAEDFGADEALLLNTEGRICETSSGNLFLIQQDHLLTPPIEAGLLPGVTRDVVLKLATNLGLKVLEAGMDPKALAAADGAFLTLSSVGIIEVTALDGQSIQKSKHTRSIHADYLRLLESETA